MDPIAAKEKGLLVPTFVGPFVMYVTGVAIPGSFVSYLRVSTDKQGRSGLGIEAQRAAVSSYLAAFGSMPVAEFVEIESGKHADRPQTVPARVLFTVSLL